MSSITSSILVNIETFAGSTAINYTPTLTNECPVLGFNCIGSSGTGTIKLTPFSSTNFSIGGSGTGGRIRITTGGDGRILTAEIGASGSGYTDGAVPVILLDPYGTAGVLACTASGGALSAISVTTPGSRYSGYISFDVSDFIEGVDYGIIPRYIEQTSGSGVLRLMGYKLPFRPMQQF